MLGSMQQFIPFNPTFALVATANESYQCRNAACHVSWPMELLGLNVTLQLPFLN
jgi:hypothetical protein